MNILNLKTKTRRLFRCGKCKTALHVPGAPCPACGSELTEAGPLVETKARRLFRYTLGSTEAEPFEGPAPTVDLDRKLEVGDIVHLLSGSPPLTIVAMNDDARTVSVVWYDEGGRQAHELPRVCVY